MQLYNCNENTLDISTLPTKAKEPTQIDIVATRKSHRFCTAQRNYRRPFDTIMSASQKFTTKKLSSQTISPQIKGLPLLIPRPRLTLIPNNRMQLNLNRILRIIATVSLTPIVAHRIRKDIAGSAESSCSDAAADFGVAFEAVLGVLVPEVEGAVRAGGAEGAVDRVEGYGVYGVDFCDVALGGVGLAVAFEGEV
jgi:hypothetical protein